MSTIKKFLIKKKILIAILLIGAFFRLFNLSNVPPSPSLDEVSIGYNAYSIFKTGADEYGTSFPLLLRAYDDFRPALYVYLVVPFIALFNVDILAVRLPSIMLSIATLIGVYHLVKELIPSISIKGKNITGETISLLTTLLLAISPWHIYISRLGHEVNAGYSFFIFGLLFLLKRNIYIAAFFIILSFISYQTEKIFIPILCLFIGIIYWRELATKWKEIIVALIVGGIILIPFIQQSLSDEGLLRFKGTNIITANQDHYYKSAQELAVAKKENNIIGQILYNRRVTTMRIIGEAYISHFNPVWLFTNSGAERHKVPNLGLLYIWEFPFIVIGLVVLFTSLSKKTKLLLIVWIISAPLSSSITTDAPHAMRSIVILPTFQLLTALGLITSYIVLKPSYLQKIAIALLIVVCLVSSIVLYRNYFVVFPQTQSSSFQYALHEAIKYVIQNEKKYDKIIISNKDALYQSYMFFLYNAKYDPYKYQKNGGTTSGGYEEIHSIDKYHFNPIQDIENSTKKILYIGTPTELLNKGKQVHVFKSIDGTIQILAVENEI